MAGSSGQPAAKKRKGNYGGQQHSAKQVGRKNSNDEREQAIIRLSKKHWHRPGTPFDNKIVEAVYGDLQASKFNKKLIAAVEFTHYLEMYLWPNFDPKTSSLAHVLSIVLMVNEKLREQNNGWTAFQQAPEHVSALFNRVQSACLLTDGSISWKEHTFLILFLVRCVQNLEIDIVRDCIIKPITGISTWVNVLEARRKHEFKGMPKLQKSWNSAQRKRAKMPAEQRAMVEQSDSFLWNLMGLFLDTLENIPELGDVEQDKIEYCCRNLELLIDLEAVLVTRRFFNTLMDSRHVLVQCMMAPLLNRSDGDLFRQLLDMLKFYANFEIHDFTGQPLTEAEMTEEHCGRVVRLQRAAFKDFPELRDFALSNIGNADTRDALVQYFNELSDAKLHQIAAMLYLVPPQENPDVTNMSRHLLLELLITKHERRLSQIEALNNMPLYPTEQVLWDENIVPSELYDDGCLALPKLNVQFLTIHDYLMRNINLFKLESTYDIRQDMEDIVPRMKPFRNATGETLFAGWSRMAQPVVGFSIVEIARPRIGESRPSSVRADVQVHLNVRDHIKQEWQGLRKHDIGFLVAIQARNRDPKDTDPNASFPQQFGIVGIRGCEIEGILDEKGQLVQDMDQTPTYKSDDRTYRVWLDCNQYQSDLAVSSHGGTDIYGAFNLFIRRNPKENNFKAVLQTIRDLMNATCVVPAWLNDVFLGFGDPATAHYKHLKLQGANAEIGVQKYNDTFLDLDHLRSSFPGHEIKIQGDAAKMQPPFQLDFGVTSAGGAFKPRKVVKKEVVPAAPKVPALKVSSYTRDLRGPYPHNLPKTNKIRFTSTQTEAIRAGMQPGLNLIVGPPGTGKTDVAVQIISNLYHNYPDQRTLIVTHSNTALNQLFEKIMALDIEQRHLLRLGRGEEDLKTDQDMSRYGRVDFILADRLKLLKRVERLAMTLEITTDVAATCETSGHFYTAQVIPQWDAFKRKLNTSKDVNQISKEFPFASFFSDAPQPLFKCKSFDEDMKIAQGCKHFIDDIFAQLKEYRAFEILHRGRDRSNYLLVKEAKIIAMTCTHAAITRSDLVELGFKYDNVLMEESAQILEIETFIPLLLQNPEDGRNRLKRVTLIGDHHQLPPVIKNMAFKKFSNMEQSLFSRFVRLGVPTVQLDAQGRSRASLSELYSWNYQGLGNLSHTLSNEEFKLANPGLRHEYQLINVEDYNGRGEHCPELHFFQNLGEAEYAVHMFMYLRLKGVPAHKISLLTTYNGQKALLRDVIDRNCASNPLFGVPNAIETVDKYQGSQNDYIILSLVRTLHVGHLRDVRRLIVAMSRARLGLYIFCRVDLFRECLELKPALDVLLRNKSTKLELYPQETLPVKRLVEDKAAEPLYVEDVTMISKVVIELSKEKLGMAKADFSLVSGSFNSAPKPTPMETEAEKTSATPAVAVPKRKREEIEADETSEASGEKVIETTIPESQEPEKKSASPVSKKAGQAKQEAKETAEKTEKKPKKPVDVAKLTVAKLKAELNKRGLPTDGKKALLVSRLKEAINSE